jgi:hypothetical protein
MENAKYRCIVASRAVMYAESFQPEKIDSSQTKYHRFDKVQRIALEDRNTVKR